MSEADIILRHLTDRVRADVNLLVQLGHVSESHASEFLEALPESGASVTVPARRLVDVPPPPAPKPVRAKALWAYNEQGTEPDLSFSAGDMVEIVSRTNDDWWTGRVNGREGLFPSNHVEVLQAEDTHSGVAKPTERGILGFLPSSLAKAPQAQSAGPVASRNIPPAPAKKAYKPFGASLHGRDLPPATSDATNSVGLQQQSGQEAKKSKVDGLKNTMAQSAAGGVGFGAGAAIGGGLIRAIF